MGVGHSLDVLLHDARPSPVHLFTVTNIQEYIKRMAQRNGNSTLLLEQEHAALEKQGLLASNQQLSLPPAAKLKSGKSPDLLVDSVKAAAKSRQGRYNTSCKSIPTATGGLKQSTGVSC